MNRRLVSLCRGMALLLAISVSLGATAQEALRADDSLFRALYGFELERSGYSPDEVARMHLTFPQSLKDFLASCNEQAQTLADCDKDILAFRPTDLLKASQPIHEVPPVATRSERPTFIILPGYIAELAEIIPYRDILDEPSQLKQTWQKLVQAAAPELQSGIHYSVVQGRDVTSPFESLILAASLDQPDGTRAANLFVIQHPRGSLESVGQLADNADRIIPRIQQLDRILPLEGPVYLVGYSRGANVSLEILSRLPQLKLSGQHPWAHQIAGMISLNGPLFGTPLGETLESNSIAGLLSFAKDLKSCAVEDSFWERHQKIQANTRLWRNSIARLLRDGGGLAGPEELKWEGISTDLIDLRLGWTIIKGAMYQDLFRLGHPVREYCENVDRFKVFVAKTIEGSEVLSTRSMQKWFETHTLPSDLDYISVSSTMMDPSTIDRVQFEGENDLCYAPGSADLQLSRSSYYQIFKSSGFQINDGFVPLHRSIFLPSLHQRWNPAQEPYEARYIGALWQHHLGVAIPMGIPMAQGRMTPFPRRDFLEALARFTGMRP